MENRAVSPALMVPWTAVFRVPSPGLSQPHRGAVVGLGCVRGAGVGRVVVGRAVLVVGRGLDGDGPGLPRAEVSEVTTEARACDGAGIAAGLGGDGPGPGGPLREQVVEADRRGRSRPAVAYRDVKDDVFAGVDCPEYRLLDTQIRLLAGDLAVVGGFRRVGGIGRRGVVVGGAVVVVGGGCDGHRL